MEILRNFGFNPYLLLAQIINFLIVFYILKRLLYKPFLTMLKKREREVKEGLAAAQQGREILEEATEKEKDILKKASNNAQKIVDSAKSEASALSKQIEENAKKQSERMLAEAREKIEQEAKESEERLSREIGRIAIAVLEKTLSKVLDKREQSEIVKKFSRSLK